MALISLSEYAKLHSVTTATLRQRIARGSLDAVKIANNWLIDSDTPYSDHRIKTGEYRG